MKLKLGIYVQGLIETKLKFMVSFCKRKKVQGLIETKLKFKFLNTLFPKINNQHDFKILI